MLMRAGTGDEHRGASEEHRVAGGYRPERQRGSALVLTAMVFCLPLVLIALLNWRPATSATPPAAHLTAFDVTDRAKSQDAPQPEEQPKETEAEVPPIPAPQAVPRPLPIPAIVIAQGPPMPPVSLASEIALPEAPPPMGAKPLSTSEQGQDTWHARVLGRLNAVKTYPATARSRRQQGTATVRFTVDRRGQVMTVALERSSGFAVLDREALALPRRTSPLPAPPADIVGDRIELVVPVEFSF